MICFEPIPRTRMCCEQELCCRSITFWRIILLFLGLQKMRKQSEFQPSLVFFFILWKCWPGYCETIGQVAMAGITSKYELVTLQKPSRPSIPWGDIGSHCATEGCALDVWIDKRSSRVAGLSWKQIPSCRLNIERHGLCHFVCCFLCVYMCLNLLLFGGCLVRVIRIATLADLWLDSCLWCWRLSLSVFGYNPVISGK